MSRAKGCRDFGLNISSRLAHTPCSKAGGELDVCESSWCDSMVCVADARPLYVHLGKAIQYGAYAAVRIITGTVWTSGWVVVKSVFASYRVIQAILLL